MRKFKSNLGDEKVLNLSAEEIEKFGWGNSEWKMEDGGEYCDPAGEKFKVEDGELYMLNYSARWEKVNELPRVNGKELSMQEIERDCEDGELYIDGNRVYTLSDLGDSDYVEI